MHDKKIPLNSVEPISFLGFIDPSHNYLEGIFLHNGSNHKNGVLYQYGDINYESNSNEGDIYTLLIIIIVICIVTIIIALATRYIKRIRQEEDYIKDQINFISEQNTALLGNNYDRDPITMV